MPMYSYICLGCGRQEVIMRPSYECGMPWKCGDCGVEMKRNFQDEKPNINGCTEYHRPIHSDALAINPGQVEEHKKKFPNIKLDSQCRPIFDNYGDHDKYLKDCNMVKEPQRIRRKGIKIKPKSNH